ncbi:anti-sigma factor family protein, partial [Streptomyces hainanensis]
MNNNHPDPAEIAALDEDLLSVEEAAELRQHLAQCTGCAEVHADLLVLRQELRDLPVPSIPDDVAARIDAALAAEATSARPAAPPTV